MLVFLQVHLGPSLQFGEQLFRSICDAHVQRQLQVLCSSKFQLQWSPISSCTPSMWGTYLVHHQSSPINDFVPALLAQTHQTHPPGTALVHTRYSSLRSRGGRCGPCPRGRRLCGRGRRCLCGRGRRCLCGRRGRSGGGPGRHPSLSTVPSHVRSFRTIRARS